MQLHDITTVTFNQLFGRLLRRALCVALLAVFAIIALYYANGAGTLALTNAFGSLHAYMIMTAIYAVAALTALTVFLAMRPRTVVTDKPQGALASPKNMQIAMLIEAVMLGYSLSRKSRLP